MSNFNSILNVNEILEEYSEEIQEEITEAAQKIAKEGALKLQETSPKRTGKYRKGWKVKTNKGKGFVSCIIHNSTNYQLTHLLENGHLNRDGSKTAAKVHIKPVEEQAINEFQKNVEKIIQDGG